MTGRPLENRCHGRLDWTLDFKIWSGKRKQHQQNVNNVSEGGKKKRHRLRSDRSTWRRSTAWTRPCRSISRSRAGCRPGGHRIPICSGRSFAPRRSPAEEERHRVYERFKARSQEAWGHVTAVLMWCRKPMIGAGGLRPLRVCFLSCGT